MRERALSEIVAILNREQAMGKVLSTERPDAGLDTIRIVACLMVVTINTCSVGFAQFGPHWQTVNIYDSLSRPSVPLFFMVSGALIAPKIDNLSKVLKRVAKVGIPLVIWSAIYLVWFWVTAPNGMTDFRDRNAVPIFGGPVTPHLWFLYTLIAIYLVVPMLQSFFQNADRRIVWFYVAAAFLAASIITPIGMLTGYQILGLDTSVFAWPVTYFLCGALLSEHKISSMEALMSALIFLAASAGTAAATAIYSTRFTLKPNEIFYVYFSPLVVIGAVSVFIFLRWFGCRYFIDRLVIHALEADTFAIYLIHPMFVYAFMIHGFNVVAYPYFWAPLIISLTCFLSSLIVVRLLRFTPLSTILVP
jgi:surface polysaccharide O-acyltransferase-like enzyme